MPNAAPGAAAARIVGPEILRPVAATMAKSSGMLIPTRRSAPVAGGTVISLVTTGPAPQRKTTQSKAAYGSRAARTSMAVLGVGTPFILRTLRLPGSESSSASRAELAV